MRSCHLALVLIGTTLHGAQALDRRPAIAIRPSSRSHDILRGGAGNKHPVVPPLVQGRVKTIRRCIKASNVISLILVVTFSLACIGSAEEDDVPIRVRVTDDSGNVGTGTAMLRRRHSSGHSPAEQARPRDEL